MCCFDRRRCALPQDRLARIATPAPGIAKPKGGEKVQVCWIGTAIGRGGADQNVVGCRFGVSNLDVEVAILGQNIGMPELEFWFYS